MPGLTDQGDHLQGFLGAVGRSLLEISVDAAVAIAFLDLIYVKAPPAPDINHSCWPHFAEPVRYVGSRPACTIRAKEPANQAEQ